MDRLKQIIGPAPSELSGEELLQRVKKERLRVSAALEAYSYRPAPKAAKAKKGKIGKSVQGLLLELGLSEEEFLDAAREVKK